MKIIIYSFSLLIFFYTNANAHECILSGTSAKEITIYNTCLSNTKQKKGQKLVTMSMLKVKVEKLKKENSLLKKNILDIKVRLNNLLSILDLYIKN